MYSGSLNAQSTDHSVLFPAQMEVTDSQLVNHSFLVALKLLYFFKCLHLLLRMQVERLIQWLERRWCGYDVLTGDDLLAVINCIEFVVISCPRGRFFKKYSPIFAIDSRSPF